MTDRVWNFSAGPATLPLSVLEEAREHLLALPGAGASILEISHRSAAFEAVIEEAEANLRDLLEIPPSHRVLFLQGGASLQFSMVPMNLLRGSATPAAYVVTGSWGQKALAEARKEGPVEVVWDGAEGGYASVPDLDELDVQADAPYLHVTSNETIQGVELPAGFETAGGPPLVCDASSDFLSRPLPVERYGLLYAGAQKNAGAAGLTVAIVREDLLERIPDGLPTMLDYRTSRRAPLAATTRRRCSRSTCCCSSRAGSATRSAASTRWQSGTARKPSSCTRRSTGARASTAATPRHTRAHS